MTSHTVDDAYVHEQVGRHTLNVRTRGPQSVVLGTMVAIIFWSGMILNSPMTSGVLVIISV